MKEFVQYQLEQIIDAFHVGTNLDFDWLTVDHWLFVKKLWAGIKDCSLITHNWDPILFQYKHFFDLFQFLKILKHKALEPEFYLNTNSSKLLRKIPL